MKPGPLMMIVALSAVIAIAACGDDDESAPTGGETPTPAASPIPSGTPSADFLAAAQEAADASLLLLSDLPPGWTGSPPTDSSDDEQLTLGAECDGLVGDLEDSPGRVASATSDDFAGPNDEEVSSGNAVFETEESAQDAIDTINDAVDGCRDEFEAALLALFRRLLEEDPDIDQATLDSVEVDVAFVDLSFEQLGDSTNAYRLDITVTAEGETIQPVADIVLLRSGRIAGGLFYFASNAPNIDDETAFARTIVSRMEAADRALPD